MRKTTNEAGSILLSVLFIVMVAIGLVGAAYMATSGQTVLTSRSADVDALESTAEGLLEYAFGQWKVDMDTNGLRNAAQTNALVTGTNRPIIPERMQIVDFSINPVDANGVITTEAVRAYDYKMSFIYTYLASVTIKTNGIGGERKVTLRRNLVYTSVPPTRGMFFSQGDFELYKPALMVIGGDVHTNANTHISANTTASNVTFQSNARVTYVGTYDNNAPAGATKWSPNDAKIDPLYAGGKANQVKRVPEITGIGVGTASQYSTTDSNPNNDGNRELIEPPVAGYEDPAAIADSRIYNTAGLLITVSGIVDPAASLSLSNGAYVGGNISIKAQNGASITATQATAIRDAVNNKVVTTVQTWVPKLVQVQVWIPTTYDSRGRVVTAGHYETQTQDQGKYVPQDVVSHKTIYDKREVQEVPITDLNLGAITPTLNAVTNFNGILYMYDNGSGDKKGLRVTNGGTLPNDGLTIATQDGMYVQGDYNTGTTTDPTKVPSNKTPGAGASTVVPNYTTKSAALVADAIMVLSNNWSDSNDSSSVGSRAATNTTLNTALIAGYLASADGGTNGRSGYSGGMNNFPRFLETWSGDAMTFSGAFVSLYQSKNFTGSWDTGDIYVPPTRYWYFDTLLLTRVLPGIPPTGGFVRGPLSRL